MGRCGRIGRVFSRFLVLVLLCQFGAAHAGWQAFHPAADAAATTTTAATHGAGHHPHDGGNAHCVDTAALTACDQHAAHSCPLCAGASCGSALLTQQAQYFVPGSPAMPAAAIVAAHSHAPTDALYRPPAFG